MDMLDNSPEALWYFRRLGANVLRMCLEAKSQRKATRALSNNFLVDTQTRRLLAKLTGTENFQDQHDRLDMEDSLMNPELFRRYETVDWKDRADRLAMFGRLIESLSPAVFSRSRTPLTDPLGYNQGK